MSKFLTICHHCQAMNNVDSGKVLQKSAFCGKCGGELKFKGRVSEVNTNELQRIIKKSEKPVIVDFWASWCGPCMAYGPIYEEASKKNLNAVFLKINTEENPQLSQQLGVRSIPTTIVFKNGSEVKREAGMLNESILANLASI